MARENIVPPSTGLQLLTPPEAPVVRDRSFLYDEQTIWPPHPDYWLIDDPHRVVNKIETPVDEHGLVNPHLLIEAVKATIHPTYEWSSRLSIHHLYWKEAWYGFPSAGEKARLFRDMSIHKILVPRIFENWLHLVTIPPNIPSEVVMQESIKAWVVARDLFKSIHTIVKYERSMQARQEHLNSDLPLAMPDEYDGEDEVGQAWLSYVLARHFRGVDRHLARLETVSPEFRLIEPEPNLATDEETRNRFVTRLGRVVVPRAVPMTRLLAA